VIADLSLRLKPLRLCGFAGDFSVFVNRVVFPYCAHRIREHAGHMRALRILTSLKI
jgi:hypothetical protein